MNRLAVLSAQWLSGVGQDVTPDGPQARQWLTEELATEDYRDGRPLLARVIDWVLEKVGELLGRFTGTGAPGEGASPLVVALTTAVLIAGMLLLLSRIRRERHTVARTEAVLGNLDLSASAFRDRGRAALRDGRWNDAVIEFTRAIAREADDRTLLTDAPSRTAHEIGAQLAPVFPDHAAMTARTMDLFDAVRYGRRAAGEGDARGVQAHDETLRKAKPALSASPPATPAPIVPGPTPDGGSQ